MPRFAGNSKDAATAFAEEYGLTVAPPAETPPAQAQPAPDQGLSALGDAAGSSITGATPAAQPQMSPDDFASLLESNPQAAAQAYVEGKVPRNKDNVQARDLVKKGIIEH